MISLCYGSDVSFDVTRYSCVEDLVLLLGPTGWCVYEDVRTWRRPKKGSWSCKWLSWDCCYKISPSLGSATLLPGLLHNPFSKQDPPSTLDYYCSLYQAIWPSNLWHCELSKSLLHMCFFCFFRCLIMVMRVLTSRTCCMPVNMF